MTVPEASSRTAIRCEPLCVWLIWCFSILSANAQSRQLQIHVSDLNHESLPGVSLAPESAGTASGLSDVNGRAVIGLPPSTRVGVWIKLDILAPRQKYIFISPQDQRVQVSPFDAPESAVEVVLAKAGDRGILQSNRAIYAIVVQIIDAAERQPHDRTGPKTDPLAEVASHFNLEKAEVESAITLWKLKSSTKTDTSKAGVIALYEKRYEDAATLLQASVTADKKRLADDSYLLGIAYNRSRKYSEAATSFEIALQINPTNVDVLEAAADNYVSLNEKPRAYSMYKRAVLAVDDDWYASSQLLLKEAAFLETWRRFDEAEAAFRRSYDIAMKDYDDPYYIAIEENVASYASYLERRGKYEHAAKLYREVFVGLASGESADAAPGYIGCVPRVWRKEHRVFTDEDVFTFLVGDAVNDVKAEMKTKWMNDLKADREAQKNGSGYCPTSGVSALQR